jgi:hypothetical protein
MKKFVAFLLIAVMLLSLASCKFPSGNGDSTTTPDDSTTPDDTTTPEDTTTPDEQPVGYEFITVDETVWVVEASAVNLRTATDSSTDETKSGISIEFGKSLRRVGYNEVWSKVVYEDEEYYVVSKYLSTSEPKEPEEIIFTNVDETVYVIADALYLRVEPSSLSVAKYCPTHGTELKRTGIFVEDEVEGTGWSRVIYKDEVLYARSYYLSLEKPTEEAQG